jgi:hypothetical protein
VTLTADRVSVMAPDSTHPNPHQIDQPADQVPDDVTDVVGSIDAIAGNRIHGWAFDRNHPDERLDVEIYVDSTPVGSVRADVFRDQLKQGGIGDGAHGFAVELPEPIPEEQYHRVSATVSKAGYGGITRLNNQAAATTKALALRPSDFAALVKHLEQCVDDQRAGFRWIYHELQELDQFIRNHAQTASATGASQAPMANAAIENQISEMAQNQTVIHESLEEMTTFQKSLNKRLEEFEVFNARIDARLEDLQQTGDAKPDTSGDHRRLKRLILFLGCLTIASLVTGILALLT